MRKTIRKTTAMVMSIIMLLGMAPLSLGWLSMEANAKSISITDNADELIVVTGIAVAPESVALVIGEEQQLIATVLPENASNRNYGWSTSDSKVATVTEDGLVKAVTSGIAVITATTADGTKTATCTVTVTAPAAVTGVVVTPETATVAISGTQQLVATVLPADAANKKTTWTTNDKNIATVSDTGVVTGVAPGRAAITATTEDGEKTDFCVITVSETAVAVTGVSVTPEELALTTGGTQQLVATVIPINAFNKNVIWKSSVPAVATVSDDGVVTAVSAGKTDITVTTADGSKVANCAVTVTNAVVAVTDVEVTPETASIPAGEKQKLTANVLPTNASNKNVEWTTNDENIAEVSEDGTVTAKSVGQAVITAKTMDGSKTDFCIVTVTKAVFAVSGVEVTPEKTSILITKTQQLTATVSPANASNKNITWSTNDAKIAEVTATGIVTAVSAGEAVITATTQDGSFTSFCIVTVVDNSVLVTDITVTPVSATIPISETQQLSAAVLPTNATNTKVLWTSSDETVATVSQTGLVTAIKAGTATITATTVDGGKTSTCAVEVIDSVVHVTSVTLSTKSANLAIGTAKSLAATVLPADAFNKKISWSSDNTAVASVSNDGVVTALKVGTAIITVKTVDGSKTDSCIIRVYDPGIAVTGVTVTPATASLSAGQTQQLIANVLPTSVGISDVVWTSSKPDVASVSSTGLVTAKAAGTAVITATSVANGKMAASCIVTVTGSIASNTLTINSTSKTVDYGNSITLQVNAVGLPENTKFEWSVTGNCVSYALSEDGKTCTITSTASGTAQVTVTALDAQGTPLTGTCTITSRAGLLQKIMNFFRKFFSIFSGFGR